MVTAATLKRRWKPLASLGYYDRISAGELAGAGYLRLEILPNPGGKPEFRPELNKIAGVRFRV
jgi:hypothetical protein